MTYAVHGHAPWPVCCGRMDYDLCYGGLRLDLLTVLRLDLLIVLRLDLLPIALRLDLLIVLRLDLLPLPIALRLDLLPLRTHTDPVATVI